MTKCQGIAGLLFGHKYQPRHSVGAASWPLPPGMTPIKCSEYFLEQMSEKTKTKKYEGDVCARCGNAINTPPA